MGAAQRIAAGVTPVRTKLLQQLRTIGQQATAAGAPTPASAPAPAQPPSWPTAVAAELNGRDAPTVSSTGAHGIQPSTVAPLPGSALSLATRLTHPLYENEDPYSAASPPLYQTATFRQRSAVECGPYDYTRSGNPTRTQLEAQLADIEVHFIHHTMADASAAISAERFYRQGEIPIVSTGSMV